MDTVNRKFFGCDCHTEGLMVEEDFETDFPDSHMFYICFWAYGRGGRKLSFFDKIKYCWKILKDGTPYGDMIVMHKDTASEMSKYLLEAIAKSEPK